MEKLIVDAEGKVTIPPEVLQKRGIRPGDELALIEAAEGMLVYQGRIDPKTLVWWQTLSPDYSYTPFARVISPNQKDGRLRCVPKHPMFPFRSHNEARHQARHDFPKVRHSYELAHG